MKKLLIAEKSSQMRSLVTALEPTAKKNKGFYEGTDYVFTNAIGHLFEIPLPVFVKDISELPKVFEPTSNPAPLYTMKENTKEQTKVILDLLRRKDIEEIICSTDPDAEGEAIFREIIESFNGKLPYQTRLIIKDTTENGLRSQFENRESISKYEGLRQRAYGRAIMDYTYGINISQALALKSGIYKLSAGRVQTPTLKMIVDRYNQKINHKKLIEFGFNVITDIPEIVLKNPNHKFSTQNEANEYISNITNLKINLSPKEGIKKPPKLHDLASIQKWGNKTLDLTAEEVLGVVQGLYDKGFVTYPRTDCKMITQETANRFNSFFGSKEGFNNEINAQVVGEVTAHEGLTITEKEYVGNQKNENAIYNQIKSVFLSNYLDSVNYSELKYSTLIEEYDYTFKQHVIHSKGYLDFYDDNPLSNVVTDFSEVSFQKIEVKEVISQPKPLFNEATLISKMQNIHSDIEDKDLQELSKSIEGIGTPATRGTIISSLFAKEYVKMDKKSIIPTEKGIKLIELLETVNSPLLNLEETAKLESRLKDVEKNKNLDIFMEEVNEKINILIDNIKNSNIQKTTSFNDNSIESKFK